MNREPPVDVVALNNREIPIIFRMHLAAVREDLSFGGNHLGTTRIKARP